MCSNVNEKAKAKHLLDISDCVVLMCAVFVCLDCIQRFAIMARTEHICECCVWCWRHCLPSKLLPRHGVSKIRINSLIETCTILFTFVHSHI